MRKCNYCKNLHKRTSRYCSDECNKNIRIRYCKHCNKQFYLKNLAYEKRGTGKYCSFVCSRFATKKFSLDEGYFQSIDNSNKAYWLGFCMADCYNSMDELIFELAIKDISHLENLKKELKSDQKVKSIKNDKFCKIRFSSRILCKNLADLGCVPKKSLIVQFPNINKIYYKDFIRGVFDGDGCIYIGKKGKRWSIYSGSKLFIEEIQKILLDNNINAKLNSQGRGYTVNLYSKQEINKIYHFLYDNAQAFLDRKRDKFIFNQLAN